MKVSFSSDNCDSKKLVATCLRKVNNDINNRSKNENFLVFNHLKLVHSVKENPNSLSNCLYTIPNSLVPICFNSSRPDEPVNCRLRFDKLMLCGDVEKNPGPGLGPVDDDRTKPSLQVSTYNVRGLGDKRKVRHLINFCHTQCLKARDSVFMFQETFVDKLDILDYIWRGEYHLTPGTGQSQGCVTLLSAPFKILHRQNLGDRGHVLVITKDNVNKAELVIANIYAPNGLGNDKLDFFEDVIQTVLDLKASHNCEASIVAGDFNLVFNSDEVRNRCLPLQEKKLSKAVLRMFNTAELVDGWANVTKRFTWTNSRNGKQMFSTLDRIMYSDSKLTLKTKDVDWSLSLSDHAMVLATFSDPYSKAKTPFVPIPRLDPRVLEDDEARRILDGEFQTLMDNASPDWNPHVALEYCKMSIRTAVFTTTGIIKARYRNEEKELNANINALITELSCVEPHSTRSELLTHKLDDLRSLKRQLIEKIGSKIEQRNARVWHNEGELSNRYFFNLLNRRTNDEINSLLIDGEQIEDRNIIESEIRNFYKELYENNGATTLSDDDDDFFSHIDQADPARADDVVKDLTLEDLEATLKTCADSSPGPDGIPYSFLKYFWSVIGKLILTSWAHSLSTGELPASHKLSYLRLIPKVGKDARIINNLRPITLSNTDHKLITKTYARKLTSAMSDLISQEQTAYLPNRLINDNVRSMLMTLDLAQIDETIDGVIVSLDAKKAFDSVDHNYIRRVLRAFGMGNFIPIFNVLYKDLKSNIILNGGVIDGYKILRGVKQGDALSCILFIMCMEPLLRNIKRNPVINTIKSTKLNVDLPKVYGYADDVNVAAKTDARGIQSIFSEYERFSKNSGLILNADKTEILRFKKVAPANRMFRVTYMGRRYELSTAEGIKINGILFFQNPKVREERNVDKVVVAMEKHLTNWSRRHLTLYGKILIAKTYAISQVVFLMQSMTLEDKSLKRINKVLFKFLWNKNFNAAKAPDRVKREIVVTSCKLGGFGMTDIYSMNKSFNVRSLGRMSKSEHPLFKQIWAEVSASGFFDPRTLLAVDKKVIEGLKLLKIKRLEILSWPIELITTNVSLMAGLAHLKVKSILTQAGKLSIVAHRTLHNRPNLNLSQVSIAELTSLERHLIDRRLLPVLRLLNLQTFTVPPNVTNLSELYPTKNMMVPISTLSSKFIRESLIPEEDSIICIYKAGLLLTPGEVLSWTKNVKKLTSSRHKCALMRIAHGDVYTNARLFRFGLIEDPKCVNCDAANEDLHHRLIGCRNATKAWQTLEGYIDKMNLPTLANVNIESLLGANGQQGKLELTLRAELVSRLMARGGKVYCPVATVRASIKTILMVEKLDAIKKELLQSVLNE